MVNVWVQVHDSCQLVQTNNRYNNSDTFLGGSNGSWYRGIINTLIMAHFGVEVRGSWYRGIINTLIMVHFGVEVSTWQLVQRNNKHNNNGTHLQCLQNGPRCFTMKDK